MITSHNKNFLHKMMFNRVFVGLVTTTIAIALPTTANAMTNDNDDSKGYFGIKAGLINVDDANNTSSIDNPAIYGAFVGYKFNENFAVEVDYTISSDADVTSNASGKGEYDVTNYGMYLAYFYPFSDSLYAKSKLGVGGAEVDERYVSGGNASSDDVGIAGGIGIGYNFTQHLSLEGELDLLRSDNIDTNALTIGARYQF